MMSIPLMSHRPLARNARDHPEQSAATNLVKALILCKSRQVTDSRPLSEPHSIADELCSIL